MKPVDILLLYVCFSLFICIAVLILCTAIKGTVDW